jgi:hypothetical protein
MGGNNCPDALFRRQLSAIELGCALFHGKRQLDAFYGTDLGEAFAPNDGSDVSGRAAIEWRSSFLHGRKSYTIGICPPTVSGQGQLWLSASK